MVLFGRPVPQRVYAATTLPREKSRVVSGGVSSREDTDIIEHRRSFVSKTISALVVSSAVCIALLSTACVNRSGNARSSAKGKPAPEFALKDANGQTVHLADYKGKVVLLDFWATWCGPCKIEIPWFMEFEQQFKDRGFAVVGVSMDEDGWTAVKPYLVRMKVNYRILLGNDQVGTLYGGVDSLPTTFLIDRQGKIASVHIGVSTGKEEFKDAIVHLLDAPRDIASSAAGGPLAVLAGAK
jgi:peroxiredoxin